MSGPDANAAGASPGFAVVGHPALNRTAGFAAAARSAGADVAIVLWGSVFDAAETWRQSWRRRTVKLETPWFEAAAKFALYAGGGASGDGTEAPGLTAFEVEELLGDTGRLCGSQVWYRGFSAALARLAELGAVDGVRFVNAPGEIAVMCDKVACHARLAAAGVPVPVAIPPPRSCDELLAAMRERRLPRVFLKPAYGSGGGGVVALETQGHRWRATTALEWEFAGAGPARLYTTSRLRTETNPAVLRPVIDALCAERLHVEAWVPKAGLEGGPCDVRVVVIGGRAGPMVVRGARGPLTNLHLGAAKIPTEILERRAGSAVVAHLRSVAESAMRCFPGSLCAGVDLAVSADLRRVVVLEVNAFGDLLEDTTWHGADAYTWEVRALLGRDWPPPADG